MQPLKSIEYDDVISLIQFDTLLNNFENELSKFQYLYLLDIQIDNS